MIIEITFAVIIMLFVGSFVLCRLMPRLGIVLSPIIAAVIVPVIALGLHSLFLYNGMNDWEALVLAILVAVLNQLLALLFILTAKRRENSPAWPQKIAMVVFIVLGIATMLAGGALLGPAGLALVIAFLVLLIRYLLIVRDARATHVFSVLCSAMRQHLSLTTALEVDAAATKGKLKIILRRINAWLTQGLPLSEALRKGYPQCPGFALAQVSAAEDVHQLPQALANIQEQMQRQATESTRLKPMNPFYVFIVIAFACLMLNLLAVLVLPAFVKILHELDAPLPALTRWLMNDLLWPLNIVFPIMLTIATLWLYTAFRPRNPWEPKTLSRMGDFCKWHWPVTRWFERQSSMLQAISMMRLSLSAGQSMDRAIFNASELDVNLCYRRRLWDWLGRVQSGEDISAAARASKVGGGFEWAFDQAVNPGQALQVLEMLETSYKAAYDYKGNLLRYILYPLATICMGSLVGVVVIALFLPLVAMIQTVISCIP
jgi:type IV pilus assembly protein PilC